MVIPRFQVGDTLELKKNHPCGEKRFTVLRAGSDIRIVCLGCGRDMTLPREKLEKSIKKVIPKAEGAVNPSPSTTKERNDHKL